MKKLVLITSLIALVSCEKEKEENLCNCGLLKQKVASEKVFILKNVCSENWKTIYNVPQYQYDGTPLGQMVCIDTLTSW